MLERRQTITDRRLSGFNYRQHSLLNDNAIKVMTAYMSIDYRILHSYVACKTNNHKNIQDLCSGDSSMVNRNHAMAIRPK